MLDIFDDNSVDEITIASISLLFVNEQLVGLLLVHDQVLSTDYSQILISLTGLDGNDFVWLSGLSWEKLDFKFTALKIVISIVNLDFINLGDEELTLTLDLKTLGTFVVLVGDWNLEVVLILSSVDDERFLVGLVSDTVSNLGTKHHLRAVHVVIHNILKLWHESLLVNEVEVDLVIGSDLDSDISLDIVNETSRVNFLVQLPFTSLSNLILLNSKEENLTRTSANECAVVD